MKEIMNHQILVEKPQKNFIKIMLMIFLMIQIIMNLFLSEIGPFGNLNILKQFRNKKAIIIKPSDHPDFEKNIKFIGSNEC